VHIQARHGIGHKRDARIGTAHHLHLSQRLAKLLTPRFKPCIKKQRVMWRLRRDHPNRIPDPESTLTGPRRVEPDRQPRHHDLMNRRPIAHRDQYVEVGRVILDRHRQPIAVNGSFYIDPVRQLTIGRHGALWGKACYRARPATPDEEQEQYEKQREPKAKDVVHHGSYL
jgi:hypothetical protein